MMKECEWAKCDHGWAQWRIEYKDGTVRYLCYGHWLELKRRHEEDKTLPPLKKNQFIGVMPNVPQNG